MFTSQDSLFYKIGPSTSSVSIPQSNVDMFMLSMSKQTFESDNDLKSLYGLAINSVYSYENLVKAVAKFPAFCDIKSTVLACKQQIAAFLAITKQLTVPDGGSIPLNKVEETCNQVSDQIDCLNYPAVESADYHWLAPIMQHYESLGLLDITSANSVQYKARGAGMIKGAAEYYRFAKAMGYVDFKTISGPNTTLDPTGAYVVDGEQHVSTTLGPDGAPVTARKQPYAFVEHNGKYDTIDLSYGTGISKDGSWLPLPRYKLFLQP